MGSVLNGAGSSSSNSEANRIPEVTITCARITGDSTTVRISPSEKVRKLKDLLSPQLGVGACQLKLIIDGTVLKDFQLLVDQGVSADAQITAVIMPPAHLPISLGESNGRGSFCMAPCADDFRIVEASAKHSTPGYRLATRAQVEPLLHQIEIPYNYICSLQDRPHKVGGPRANEAYNWFGFDSTGNEGHAMLITNEAYAEHKTRSRR